MIKQLLETEETKEQPNQLPAGWSWTPLSGLIQFSQNGLSKRNGEAGEPIVVLRLADIVDGSISLARSRQIRLSSKEVQKYELSVGDVLCIRVNGSRNLVGRLIEYTSTGEPVAYCDHFIRLCTNSTLLHPTYLAFYSSTDSARQHIERNMVSTAGQNTVSQQTIASLRIPLPPLPEQRRIVAKIEELFSELDAGVATLKRIQAALKRYRASVLKAACEGKLVPQDPSGEPASQLLERILAERRAKWEEEQRAKGKDPAKVKYEEPLPPDVEGLPELPEGWVWSNIERLAEITPNALKAGPFGSALKKEFYTETGYKIYGQEQVIRGDPFYGDYYIDEQRYKALRACAVKPGDVLVSLVGTIGKVLVLPAGIAAGIINPRLLKLSLDTRMIDPSYLRIYIESHAARHFFSLASHGGTMDILNLKILKQLPIPVPPLAEQKRILNEIEYFTSLTEQIGATVEANLKRAERLRQAILKRAFEGRLVPQDPADESAGVLLERIRAQRETQAPLPRRSVVNSGEMEQPTFMGSPERQAQYVQSALPLDNE
jgi:type I restriction enzyme S subunit